MLRSICIVFVGCLLLALPPRLAMAQTVLGVPTRAIQTASPGYCFTDLNNNSAVDLNEIDVSAGTEAMTDATVPARNAVTTGNRTITPSAIHAFNNWANITALGDYNIDIAGFCVGKVSRTDVVNTALDDNGNGSADRTVTTTRTENSAENNYFDDDGFTFVGGTASNDQVISFSGQVTGNIGAIANQSHISLTFNNDVEIDGLLDLGNTNAISDAVLNLAGQIDEVDLDGAADLTVTSSATIGDSGSSATNYTSSTVGTLGLASVTDSNFTLSGNITSIDLAAASNITIDNSASVTDIDATNITNGVFFTNASQVGSIDLSGTKYLDLDLNTGSLVGALTTNNSTSSSSLIDNAGGIERLEIGNSSATEKVEMAVINSGEISALTSGAFVINDANAGGGEIDVTIDNTGAIKAATSKAVDLSSLDGGRLDFKNSGSVSTNASGNNNAIFGNGAKGLIFMENSGTISSSANHALNLKNIEGYLRIVNSGSITTNQKAIDLTGATGSTTSVVAIHNGYVVNSNGNIQEATSGSREIKATGQNAILLDGVTGDIRLANAAGANIIAEDSLAIAASGVTGNINLTNAGNIRARRVTPGLSNNKAIALTGTKGDISFTSTAGLIDARDQTVNLETVNGKINFSNSGVISSTQAINDADATATDNYAVRLHRSGIVDDESMIANSGTISSTSDHGILISGLACDADGAIDNYCLTNSGTLSAGRQYAIAGSSISDLKFTNSGTVSALDQTINLTDLSGAVVFANSGQIAATQEFDSLFPDSDNEKYAIRLVKKGGEDTTIQFSNASGGAISTNAGDALVLSGFNGTNDNVSFSNDGTISTSQDNAVNLSNSNFSALSNKGSIAAGGNYAILLDGVVGANMAISNLGSITAGANQVGNAPAAIRGSLAASVDAISITTGASSTISSVGNVLANADNNSGGAIFLDAAAASFTLNNGGTILVGAEGTPNSSAVAGNNAIRIAGIGNNPVSITNASTGSIKAVGDRAVYLKGGGANMSAFTLNNSGTITAANEVLVLEDVSGASTTIKNSGIISGTSQSADHVLRLVGFGGELAIENKANGSISSNGSNAIYADHQSAAPSLDFDNIGSISARTGNAVVLSGFTDVVSVVNSGTIEVTAGNTAFSSWGGNETVFVNSGRIEASGSNAVRFSNFLVDAGTAAPQFTNTTTGLIRAGSSAFEADIGSATGQIYSLDNAGSIIADNGAHAINMSGGTIALTNSGTISSAASPAILVGASSVINISGSVSAGGVNPVAIALEGRGSTVNLSDGAIIVGIIAPLDSATDYSEEQKHRVNVSGVNNASHYYEYPTEQFRFFLDNVEKTDGSGFSPATTNLEAVPLMHGHHAQGIRNTWRRLGRFNDMGGFRSYAFADELENKRRTDRDFILEGDRSGFVQTFQKSIFGWFEAELILTAQESSFELDNNTFTFDKSYQGVGLGFSDLLAFGPFSFSAMALTGIGQTDMSRLVLSNTVSSGRFNLESSFDTVYLDAAFEALFDMRLWGKKGRLTRRNPYRINLELGLGGSLHSENNDSYDEQTYISAADSNLQSSSVGGRLKFEYERYNTYSRKNIRGFLELEHNIFDIGSGLDFSYSVEGAAQSAYIDMVAVELSSIALGVDYEVNDDITTNFSLKSVTGDDDSDEKSLALALKWRF